MGKLSKKESLYKAAQMYAALGYMRRYCDIMVEIGEWDKAIMAAPAVSIAYWQQLSSKRALALAEEDKADSVPLLVATGVVGSGGGGMGDGVSGEG